MPKLQATVADITREFVANLSSALRESTALRWALWWELVLFLISLAALPFDSRHILGLNPWIKPIKFQLSVSAYLITLAMFLHALGMDSVRNTGKRDTALRNAVLGNTAWLRSRLWLGIGFAICMTLENTIITLQAARGVRSHMNYTTTQDALLFAAMGIGVMVNTALVAWLLVLWCFARPRVAAATKWGVALGLIMLLLGSLEGAAIVSHGAHTIGAKDGLDGLPFLNWSRRNGDLRVAHFFAIHALQIFPLAGVFLARTRLRSKFQIGLVCLFAVVYTGGVWWLFAEAMRGHPLLAY